MQVSAISTIGSQHIALGKANNNIKQSKLNTNATNDIFIQNSQPTFKGGYTETILKAANAVFKNETELEQGFKTLLGALRSDTSIVKSDKLKLITDLYDEKGFRGLLHELWLAHPRKDIEKLVNEAQEDIIYLAGKKDESALTVSSIGRLGFWNLLRDNPNAPRDVDLAFWSPKNENYIRFSLNKKGGCELLQRTSMESVETVYYPETGTPKEIATISKYSRHPEVKYFNRDGSPNGLKNWLYGNPTEPIY